MLCVLMCPQKAGFGWDKSNKNLAIANMLENIYRLKKNVCLILWTNIGDFGEAHAVCMHSTARRYNVLEHEIPFKLCLNE